MKEILFGNDIRLKILEGVELLSNAVKITLGPKGKNVILEKLHNYPLITKDGVTVAKNIDLKDRFKNMGAQAVKEVACKTNDKAGDGTTTATILAHYIIKEGMKYLIMGVNATDLRKGIEKAVKLAIKELENHSKICNSSKEIAQVASISANNNIEIGNYIARAVDKIGKEGIITIEDSSSTDNEIEIAEGMQFDKGYFSPYFITDDDKQTCILENSLILIYNKKIYNINQLINILELVSKSTKTLLIMCEDIDNDVLTTLIFNNMRGNIKLCAVKLPSYGDKRKEVLEDISILTGAKIINDELSLEQTSVLDLGQVRRLEIHKEFTIIIEGAGGNKNISYRIKELSNQIKKAETQYDSEKLQERLSKLSNGVAIIRIGANTEIELREKKFRVEDALHATKAAIEEGILPGGGISLLKIKQKLSFLKGENEDQNNGIKLLLRAMEEPFRQMIINAGGDVSIILENIIKGNNFNYGYNILDNKYGDLINMGVIDPAKVTKNALLNASSVACLLLNTDAGYIDINKNEEEKRDEDEEEGDTLDDLDI